MHRRSIDRATPRLIVALATVLTLACAGQPEPGAGATFRLTSENALLWKVAKQGSDAADLYLLGSIHMLDMPLTIGPEIERAFRRADVLVLEIDFRTLTHEALVELMIRYGTLGSGEQLDDSVSQETLERLDAHLALQGISPPESDGLRRMRPWVIALTIENLRSEQAGLRQQYGVDRYFLARADETMPTIGLETIDEQMFALSSHSAATQEEMLRQALDTSDAGELLRLIELWKAGNADAMAKLVYPSDMGDAPPEMHEFYETVYFARNERMADGLKELLEEDDGQVLFAVLGAAHLIGDDNVRTILREAGYAVTRISD